MPVSRHDDGIRLLQNLLLGFFGEVPSWKRKKKEEEKAKEKREERGMRNKTVVSVLRIAVAHWPYQLEETMWIGTRCVN